MLLQLAYLGVSNAFALLRLLPMSDRDKDAHVATAPAPEQDIDALDRIHQGLKAAGLCPVEHYVDAGNVNPAAIAKSAQHFGIALIGLVRPDTKAALHPGFTKAEFSIDWASRTVTGPNGIQSPPWKPTSSDGQPAISVLFSARRAAPTRTAWSAPATPTAEAGT